MDFLKDLFTSESGFNGTPTVDGPGDGAKGDRITEYLGKITGLYEVVTGQGKVNGPAPNTSTATAKADQKFWLLGVGAVVVALVLFLVLKKK